jgi:hypothetical protein
MDIGPEKAPYVIEPIESPVPGVESPAAPDPDAVPDFPPAPTPDPEEVPVPA